MTIEDDIRLDALSRGVGSFRSLCPSCGGGSTREASLSVTVNSRSQVSWRCFRASCGKSGGNMEVRPTTTPVRRPYKGETRQITESERTQYGLPYAHYRVSCKDGRVVLPISGPNNELLGHILRDFTGTLTPKVLTYKDTDGPFIHWAVNMHANKDIVIVEDWLSAEAVGRLGGVAGVALLGTHLTDEAQKQILHNAGEAQVHVALDRDAFVKGVKLAAKLAACLWRPVFTWRLDRDLKHVRPERIERAINEREFDFISNP